MLRVFAVLTADAHEKLSPIRCRLISRRFAISDGIQSKFPIDKPVPYDLVKGIIGDNATEDLKEMKGEK